MGAECLGDCPLAMGLTSTYELWGEIHIHEAAKYWSNAFQGQTFRIVKMAVAKAVNVEEVLYLGSLPFKEVFVCICFDQRRKNIFMCILELRDNSKEHKGK